MARPRSALVVRFTRWRSFDLLDEEEPPGGHRARKVGAGTTPQARARRGSDPRRPGSTATTFLPIRGSEIPTTTQSETLECLRSRASTSDGWIIFGAPGARCVGAAVVRVENRHVGKRGLERVVRRRGSAARQTTRWFGALSTSDPCRGREGGEQRPGERVPADRQDDDALLLDGEPDELRVEPGRVDEDHAPFPCSAFRAPRRGRCRCASGAAGNRVSPDSLLAEATSCVARKMRSSALGIFDLPLEGGVARGDRALVAARRPRRSGAAIASGSGGLRRVRTLRRSRAMRRPPWRRSRRSPCGVRRPTSRCRHSVARRAACGRRRTSRGIRGSSAGRLPPCRPDVSPASVMQVPGE